MSFDKKAWRAQAVTIEQEVPFYECDPLFVVWHGRYFQYLERARQALLRKFHLDVPDVRHMGYRMYITDARCRYMFPLSYGDRVAVTAWFTEFEPLLPDDRQAPIIVTFHTPADPRFDFEVFYSCLKQRGFVIYPGKLTGADTFRVGCIGNLTSAEMRGALGAIREALQELGVESAAPEQTAATAA